MLSDIYHDDGTDGGKVVTLSLSDHEMRPNRGLAASEATLPALARRRPHRTAPDPGKAAPHLMSGSQRR